MALCVECHEGLVDANSTSIHGPIQKGMCSSCHDPHGTSHEKLLIKSYSSKLFISYSEDAYQLCFSCHDRLLVRFPDTSFSTGFRNGDRNLHYLHVNKSHRGRNCNICHAAHDSNLPKLMADTVPFGKWRLPINFKKTATGGSCSPGCHKTVSYDRERPILQ